MILKNHQPLYGVFTIVLVQNGYKDNVLYPKSVISACFY